MERLFFVWKRFAKVGLKVVYNGVTNKESGKQKPLEPIQKGWKRVAKPQNTIVYNEVTKTNQKYLNQNKFWRKLK